MGYFLLIGINEPRIITGSMKTDREFDLESFIKLPDFRSDTNRDTVILLEPIPVYLNHMNAL